MNNNETRSNPSGRLFGDYRAIVVDNKHPDGLHLAKVRLVGQEYIPDDDLPWAEYQLPLGVRPKEGDALPVQKDDQVWIDFPYFGDTRRPRITGGAYTAPNGVSNLPADLFKPTYEHKRGKGAPPGPKVEYGDKTSDLFGILQQLTMAGDYCITHKATGTSFHITPDGKLVFHVEADHFRTVNGNVLEEISKDLTIIVKGNVKVEAKNATVDADTIKLNGGEGVVTGAHICQYTGSPHSDCSSTVTAGK